MSRKHEKISVCIPSYNSGKTILETIWSIQNQTIKDYELIIVDDASTDNTVEIVQGIKDSRIHLYINDKNIGCGKNLQKCKNKSNGEIVVFLAGDDLFDKFALKKIRNAFESSREIGVVLRPYFWFIGNDLTPVRITRQFSKDITVSLKSDYKRIIDAISLSDQMSGIAFRKKWLTFPFDNQPFIEMGYAVMRVLKEHKAKILKDNILGVRIGNNGSMNPNVYKNSPMAVWKKAIDSVYSEEKYSQLRKCLLSNFIATNYIGLIQIKNYGTTHQLWREIRLLVEYRWENLLSMKFILYCLLSLLMPKIYLIRLVDLYKRHLNSKRININHFDSGIIKK